MRTRLALLIAMVALPAPVSAGPVVSRIEVKPASVDAGDEVLALARVTSTWHLPVVPPEVVDGMVRWRTQARDLVYGAIDNLVALADDIPTPDLTVLTTDPIVGLSTNQSSGFGWRDDPINHNVRWHGGTDFRSKPGTSVVAAGDGIVVFAAYQGGYGNVVYIDHGGGLVTRYAHLSRIVAKKDATIMAGQELGKVGSTGRATGPHLHFEVRIDAQPVSPVLAMQVATVQRELPETGRVLAFALRPELQSHAHAGDDKPRGNEPVAKDSQQQRPDRASRKRQPKPLW